MPEPEVIGSSSIARMSTWVWAGTNLLLQQSDYERGYELGYRLGTIAGPCCCLFSVTLGVGGIVALVVVLVRRSQRG